MVTLENSSPIIVEAAATELPFIAGAGGVTAGQAVYISANGTVLPTSGAMECVGIVKVGAAAGKLCSVAVGKQAKVRVTASGAINAGDEVVSAASGKVASLAATAITQASIETTGAVDDAKLVAAINTAINNSRYAFAVCETGATDGNQAVIILKK